MAAAHICKAVLTGVARSCHAAFAVVICCVTSASSRGVAVGWRYRN